MSNCKREQSRAKESQPILRDFTSAPGPYLPGFSHFPERCGLRPSLRSIRSMRFSRNFLVDVDGGAKRSDRANRVEVSIAVLHRCACLGLFRCTTLPSDLHCPRWRFWYQPLSALEQTTLYAAPVLVRRSDQYSFTTCRIAPPLMNWAIRVPWNASRHITGRQ